jgi:hypothetical protein
MTSARLTISTASDRLRALRFNSRLSGGAKTTLPKLMPTNIQHNTQRTHNASLTYCTRLSPFNGLSGPGRPTKRTKKVVTELLDAISAGAPFNIACQASGITYQTFQDWRRRDPAFALEVDQAAARGTVSRLKEIESQGKNGAWQALSWLCERRHPAEFAKPEVALNIGVGIQTGGGNGSQNFEALIVSDLEFLGLRKHQGYEHRQPIEVESEVVVPSDVSGTLLRSDHPGGAIVSQSQAEATEKRVSAADSKISTLLKAKRPQA